MKLFEKIDEKNNNNALVRCFVFDAVIQLLYSVDILFLLGRLFIQQQHIQGDRFELFK